MNSLVGWCLLAAGAILLIDAIVRMVYIRVILPIFEARPPFNVTPHEPLAGAERVSCRTTDNVVLRGGVFRGDQPPRGVIVFFPEVDGSFWSAGYYAEALLRAGYDVVSFDFRNQGDSESLPDYVPLHWPTTAELRDADAVLDFVARRDDWRELPVGVFGVSRGSLVALIAGAKSARVQAVCGECPYTVDSLMEHFVQRWGRVYLPPWLFRALPAWHVRLTLRLVRWISECRRGQRYAIVERWLPRLRHRPVLLLAGGRDNYVPVDVVRTIERRLAAPRTELWLVPGAKHNQGREVARDEYDRRLVEHFDQMAAPQSDLTTVLTPVAVPH